MSGRPGEWHLLGVDSDPLPGDEYDVSSESTHYDNTATAIREQVARLRTIAGGDNSLVGKYAPALEDSARDLADHLDDAQGRFDTVAKQLKVWAPVLSDGITRTGTMLQQAETAQSTIDANQAPDTPVDKKDQAAVTADHQRGSRLSGAQDDLSDVQGRFNTLMSSINDTADHVAKMIDDASHDSLKDSWWDSHVRKWIHDHAGLLKVIADVLTWIATAIIIVILVVGTGGLGLALLLTAGALLIHTMLAANGDGSWVDVGLDVFAIVTMGSGKLLSSGAKTMLAMREGGGAFAETSATARIAFSKASGFLGKSGAWLSKSNVLARNTRGAYAGLGRFNQVMNAEFTGGKLVDVLTMGEKGSAGLYKAVNASMDKFGPGFLLNTAHGMMNATRVTFLGGLGVDVASKTLNPAFNRKGLHELAQLPTPAQLPLKGLDAVLPDSVDNLKPPVTGFSAWTEDHTVSNGGYW